MDLESQKRVMKIYHLPYQWHMPRQLPGEYLYSNQEYPWVQGYALPLPSSESLHLLAPLPPPPTENDDRTFFSRCLWIKYHGPYDEVDDVVWSTVGFYEY